MPFLRNKIKKSSKISKSGTKKYYFYILKCADKTLYCGVTKDLANRARLHNLGKGSVYVRTHGGGRIVYSEIFKTLGDALRREIEVKKWPREKKMNLID
jgi:putative endonuclease